MPAIRMIGIIGAGTMGRSIAAVHAAHGMAVRLTDVSDEVAAQAAEALCRELAGMVEDRASRIEDRRTRIGGRADDHSPLTTHHSPAGSRRSIPDSGLGRDYRPPIIPAALDALAECELVIETVPEQPRLKRRVLARVERLLREDALLVTNTSAIPIGRLAECLARPERFCGMHFCHPVRDRRLVEVVRGSQTGKEAIAAAVRHARRIGKIPVVVNDGAGFLLNRVLLPCLNEATLLVEEGLPPEEIDGAARRFGLPWGPLEQLDEIGIDVAVRAGAVIHAAFPDRVVVPELLLAHYRAGRLGKKCGAGFYEYYEPRRSRIEGRGSRPSTLDSRSSILRRLLLPMLVEATRALEDGVAASAGDVDLALIHGIGFPPSRGGLLGWCDDHGARRVVQWLEELRQLGRRFEPSRTLLKMADRDGRFYGGSTAAA